MTTPAPRKGKRLEIRLDPQLQAELEVRLKAFGWELSPVVRALLVYWLKHDMLVGLNVGAARKRAPRTIRKLKPSPRKTRA